MSTGRLAILGLAALLLQGCSVEADDSNIAEDAVKVTGEIAVRDTTIVNSGEGGAAATKQSELSLALFKEHIYPVLKKNCASCHGTTAAPIFAQDDELASFTALAKANKVNFDNPVQSRLVLRLSQDLHNCWSDCSENATIIKSGIDNWKAGLESGGAAGGKSFPFKTAELAVTAIRTIKTSDPVKPGIIVFDAESTILKAPYSVVTNAAASGGKVITTLTGGAIAPAGLVDPVADLSALGSFTIDFEIDEDGFYQVFAKVIAAANSDTVYYKMNDLPVKTWNVTNTATLAWQQLTMAEAPGGVEKFELLKGKNKLVFYQAEDNLIFDMFIITNRTLGDMNDYTSSPLNSAALIFSLKDILNLDVSLAIAFEQLDAVTYLLRSPVLINETGKTLTLKGVYPMLNGVWTEQNATYSKSKITTADRITSLSTAAMSVVADKGLAIDKLSLGIDILKIVE